MKDVKQPNLIEIMIIADVKLLMKKCDDDEERDFLNEFGKFRKEIVYQKEIISDDRFDELCQMVLNDLKDEDGIDE